MSWTSTEKAERRRETLLRWKEASEARGHSTPSTESLTSIASSGSLPAASRTDGVGEWRVTLEWLLHQMKMGVIDPVTQLPNELLAPADSPTARSDSPVSSGASNGAIEIADGTPAPVSRLDALREWRRAAIGSGRVELSSLKESKLAQIVRQNRTAPGEIEPMLPQSLRGFAAEIADVLSQLAPEVQSQPVEHTGGAAHDSEQAVTPPARLETPPGGRSGTERRSRTSATMGAFLDLVNEDFEEYDYSSVPGAVQTIKATSSGSGTVFGWPAYEVDDGDIAVYRLVSNNEYPPYAPEGATFIGATTDIRVTDPTGFDSAVRFVQVWVNVGTDIDDATAAQPVLHAQTAVVSPVNDVQIREDEGRVIGQWTVYDGTSAVQVFRIPIERAAFGGDDPQYRIASDEPNLGGFVDRSAERGKRYLYRVRAEASVDGTTRLSGHTQVELLLSASLEAVTDLTVDVHGGEDDPQFDLTWTTPSGGRVIIYRTVGGPNPGAEATPLAEAALATAGLPPDTRLSHPVVAGGAAQTSAMSNVPWPREWNRAYFTAVTVLGDRVQVGSTTSATRTGLIQHAEVVERVNKQVLTFAWPAGAASVLVHVGPRGQSAEHGISGHPVEISSGMYERFGGLHFPNQLPQAGCSLHLVPVAFAKGDRIHGQPVTVDYPGLLRVFYDANISRGVTGKPTSVTVSIAAEIDVEGSPPFVLVHNAERLPLNSRDGNVLDVVGVGNEAAGATKQFILPRLSTRPDGLQYRADVKDKVGFVRLFAQMPAARLATFALIDPPVAKLILQHARRR